jgi:hypothetical protein
MFDLWLCKTEYKLVKKKRIKSNDYEVYKKKYKLKTTFLFYALWETNYINHAESFR